MGMNDLNGKVALVTGSSRGIGAAIAQRLGAEGMKVAVHGRDAAAVEAVRARIPGAVGVTGDLTKLADVEAMRGKVEASLGPVDLVVANAAGGFSMPGPLEETSEEAWRSSIDGVLTATFFTLKVFLPGMKQRKSGNVITISSTAGRRPHPRSPVPYAAAKAGLQLMTQDVAAQAGPFGVRVNCIAPETILTERTSSRIPAEMQKQLAAAHPIPRLGVPADVANAVVFLASDQASWITGVVLDVAGGNQGL